MISSNVAPVKILVKSTCASSYVITNQMNRISRMTLSGTFQVFMVECRPEVNSFPGVDENIAAVVQISLSFTKLFFPWATGFFIQFCHSLQNDHF